MAALPKPKLPGAASILALGEKLLTFSLGGGAGLVVERFLHWSVGPFLDPWLKDLAAAITTRRKLAKLRRYEAGGQLPQLEVRKLEIRIAKQDINGGPRVANRPATYQKRGVPIGSSAGPSPATPPAAGPPTASPLTASPPMEN